MTQTPPELPQAYQPPAHVPVDAYEPPFDQAFHSYESARSDRTKWWIAGLALLVAVGSVLVVSAFQPEAMVTARVASAPSASVAPATVGGWPELTALPGEAEAEARSATDGAATRVRFLNRSSETVTVSWLDYGRQRVWYAELGPGQTYDQATYAGHVWVVARADGTAVAVFTAAPEPSRAIIS